MGTLVQVALGGALGATIRHLSGVVATRLAGHAFPWGTLFVNVAGSFLMGVVVVVLARHGGAWLSPFLATGLLGGFTTFSSFSLDAVTLFDRGQTALAALYVGASVVVCLAAIAAGLAVARALA